MIKTLALALSLMLGAQTASAASWRFAGASGQRPNRIAIWIDADSLRPDGSEVTFWFREVLESPDEDRRTGSDALTRANCREFSYQFLEMSDFTMGGPGPAHRVTMDVQHADSGTHMAAMIDLACGRRDLTPAVLDPERFTRDFWRRG